MKATSSLNKIAGLKKRIRVIQGGQGAGKTYAILIILINHALSKSNKEIFIASHELSKMRITIIKDFINICKDIGIYNSEHMTMTGGTHASFFNGSFIRFLGLDKTDIGKGLRSDVVFINECNKVKFETYRELTSRAENIYLDFNPNAKFWVHDEVINRPDAQFITLTFKDNEFLGDVEVGEILRYKEKGYDDEGNEINPYWANMWRVYGLGLVGITQGTVFQNWKEYDEDPEDLPFMYGIDWGYNDPFVIVQVFFNWQKKELFVKEIAYLTQLKPDGCLEVANQRVNDKTKLTVCDHSPAMRTMFLDDGWNIYNAKKDTVEEKTKQLQNWQIFVHKDSLNIKEELYNYKYSDKDPERPIDAFNHAIDAITYVEREIRYEIVG